MSSDHFMPPSNTHWDGKLTNNSILKVFHTDNKSIEEPFVVQVIEVELKNFPNKTQDNKNRWWLHISDGTHMIPTLIISQCNNLVKDQVKTNTIIRVNECVVNTVQATRKVVIIKSFSVITDHPTRIGNPAILEMTSTQPIQGAPYSSSSFQQQTFPPQQFPPQQNNPNSLVSQSSISSSYPPKFQYQQYPLSNNQISSSNIQQPNQQIIISNNREFCSPSVYNQQYQPSINTLEAGYVPVETLNPYITNWKIKVRVTQKTDIKYYVKAQQGHLFSVDLLDANGTEIRAAFFNDSCDKFFDIIQKGKVYSMSKGSIRVSLKKFSSINNDYEISFNADSEIELIPEDDTNIPNSHYHFSLIEDLCDLPEDSNIDIIGVVTHVGQSSSFTTKKNIPTQRRNITLVDTSGKTVEITLWGDTANQIFEEYVDRIIAFKSVQLSSYNGRSLSFSYSSSYEIDPDRPEAHKLKGWYLQEKSKGNLNFIPIGNPSSGRSTSQRVTIESILSNTLEQPTIFTVRAMIAEVLANDERLPFYQSCPCVEPECKKKVTPDHTGTQYFCEKCDKAYPNYKLRYKVTVVLTDSTGSMFCTLFDAQNLFDTSTEELQLLLQQNKKTEFNQIMKKPVFYKWIVTLRASRNYVQDASQIRCIGISFEKISPEKESTLMLDQITQMKKSLITNKNKN